MTLAYMLDIKGLSIISENKFITKYGKLSGTNFKKFFDISKSSFTNFIGKLTLHVQLSKVLCLFAYFQHIFEVS